MTDRELLEKVLEAMEHLNRTGDTQVFDLCYAPELIPALRERLAQPEHHDPIGDAQDKLIAEQVASHDYRTRYDRGCYKCGSHYCPADCPMPTHLVPQQPQMQPCAGRNCGSIDPNLHSAECFEDYEKSTGMAQPEQEPVALESVYETIIQWDEGGGKRSRRELARRIAALYTTPPRREWVGLTRTERFEIEKAMSKYYDYRHECKTVCLPEFAAAIEAKLREKNNA